MIMNSMSNDGPEENIIAKLFRSICIPLYSLSNPEHQEKDKKISSRLVISLTCQDRTFQKKKATGQDQTGLNTLKYVVHPT